MKLKNASFFQLHIEKIVLAAGVLFLLVAVAVVVFGAVLKPYQVELGSQTFDDPSEVPPFLVDRAGVLEAGLKNTSPVPPGVDEGYTAPDLGTNYEQMLNQPLLQSAAFAPISQMGLTGSMVNPVDPDAPEYYLPTPPMVAETHVKYGFEVLDTTDRTVRQAYETLWGESRTPADFSYVFIEGQFDMYDWIERLESDNDTMASVPPGIWEQKLGLATVYLLRQERDPVTGQWSESTVVTLLPDYIGIQPKGEMTDDREIALQWIDYLLSNQLSIAMADPPLLAEGKELLSPLDDPMTMFDEEAFEAMEAAERAQRAADARARRDAQRAAREAERNRGGNNTPGGGGLEPGGGRGGPGAGRGGRGGRGGSGGGRDAAPPSRGTPDRDRGNPGGDLPGRSTIPGPSTPGRPGGLPEMPDATEMEEGMVRVWAIDVTAVPGTTYRYKLVAGVINPLYGVDRLEEAQRSANRHRAALLPSDEDIAKTPWEEIEFQPSTRFFVNSANDRGARVKVHRIFNGQWHEQLFEVNPGDQIGGIVTQEDEEGVDRQIDMQVGVTVVDIDRRTNIDGKTLWVLIYIDENGNLHERLLDEDKAASSAFDRELTRQREAERWAQEMMEQPQQPGPGGGLPGRGGPGGLNPGGLNPGGLDPGGRPIR
ncbi:MAG: hypothetical protein ACIAXF_15255 [Phycisphaerales bacterium JB063]